MCFVTTIEQQLRQKLALGREHVPVIELIRLLVDGMWIWGLWIRRAVDCCKWGMMGHTRRCTEESGTEGNVDYRGPAQEVSEEVGLLGTTLICRQRS